MTRALLSFSSPCVFAMHFDPLGLNASTEAVGTLLERLAAKKKEKVTHFLPLCRVVLAF